MTDNLDSINNEALDDSNPQDEQGQDLDLTINDDDSDELKRYKQQVTGSRLEAQVLNETLNLKEQGADYMLDIYKKDPNLADKVAKKLKYDDYEDFKKTYFNDDGNDVDDEDTDDDDNYNKPFSQKDFDKMYEERRKKEIHNEAIEKVNNAFSKLDDDEQKKADSYFKKITKGMTLSMDEAMEFAEMTTLYVTKDKKKSSIYDEGLVSFGSTGLSSGNSKSSSGKEEWIVQDGKLILKSNK